MNPGDIRIADFVPHADSMCLLDALQSWDEHGLKALSHCHLDPHNPLRHAGRLGAACGIEIAAQGMALHGALLARQAPGDRPRAGFLASLREIKLHTTRLDTLASALCIAVQRQSGDDNTVLYQFQLKSDGALLIEGRAAVMLDAAKVSKP